jgi:hypothetical protein
MKWWTVIPLAPFLAACPAAPESGNDGPILMSMPWVSTVRACQRTPAAPDGLIDQAVLEEYIAELSKRLEACADKVDTQNNRIERARRRKVP